MKKFLILFIFLYVVLCFGFKIDVFGFNLNYSKNMEIDIINETEIKENDIEDFTFILNNKDNLENIQILIDIYYSIPEYDDQGTIVQFNNIFSSTYIITKNCTIIDRVSEYMLIQVNLDSLPSGYGVSSTTYFVNNNVDHYEICLREIYDCQVNYYRDDMHVEFLSEDDEVVYSNYKIKNKGNENIYSIVIGNNDFIKDVYVIKNQEGKEQYYTVDNNTKQNRGIFDVENSYTPSYTNVATFRNSGSKFIIYYDRATMDATLAERVADRIELIDEFFCGADEGICMARPKTNSDNEYKIYLETDTNLNGLLGKTNAQIKSNKLGKKTGVYSYICINYDLISQVGDYINGSVNSFVNTLAHEYFHALQAQAGIDFHETNNRSIHWLIEATATAVGLYYYNSINPNGVVDSYVDNLFNNRIHYYFSSSNRTINDYTVESDDIEADNREYSTFIFFLYLIKEYGFNIISELIVLHGTSQNTLSVINELLQAYGTDLETLFKEFSISNSYIYDNYNDILNNSYIDGWKYYYNEEADEKNNNYPGVFKIEYGSQIMRGFNLSYLSSYYLYLKSEDDLRYNVFVTINLASINNADITSARKTEDGDIYYHTYNLSTTSITIPQYNFGYHICKELCFIITNSSNSNDQIVWYNVDVQ